MEQLRYINIIVITVIIVMEELKQTFLFSAGVLVFDTTRAEHIAGIMLHLPGELVRLYIRNIRCNKQFLTTFGKLQTTLTRSENGRVQLRNCLLQRRFLM